MAHHKKAHHDEPTDAELEEQFSESLDKEIDKQQGGHPEKAGTNLYTMSSTVTAMVDDQVYIKIKQKAH
jgi:hypothetical protein